MIETRMRKRFLVIPQHSYITDEQFFSQLRVRPPNPLPARYLRQMEMVRKL